MGLAARQRLSPEFAARLAYPATETGAYERAARRADNWGHPAGDGRLYDLVQNLGAGAADLVLPTPEPPPHEPPFSLVIMPDGWMARERGPDWGAEAELEKPQRSAWHEIKSAIIYRLEQRAETAGGRGLLIEKHVVATPPEIWLVDCGALLLDEARRGGLGRARKVYVVMDGAVWLWDMVADRLTNACQTLDFHHARDHLWAVAHRRHGEDTPAAGAWVQPLLQSLRHGGEARVVQRLEQLLEPAAAPGSSSPISAMVSAGAESGANH